MRISINAALDGARIACPFDVLFIFSKDFPETNAMLAVNLVAQLLDQNNDGVADSSDLQKLLRYSSGVWITGGNSVAEEETMCTNIPGNVACIGLKHYGVASTEADDVKLTQASIEAIFQWMTRYGWGKLFPN